MKRGFSIFLFLNFFISAISQKDSSYLRKNRLPYYKYTGLKLLYFKVSPSLAFSTPEFDYALDITVSPTFAYYINRKIEAIAEYSFTFVKYGSLSPVNSEGFNQITVGINYFPLNSINFLFIETGLQYGNYATEKISERLMKKWAGSMALGTGVEVLTKKKIVVKFNARIVLPLNSKYNYDFVRSIGIGFQLNRKKKP